MEPLNDLLSEVKFDEEMHCLSITKRLYHGPFSSVFKLKDSNTGTPYAMKIESTQLKRPSLQHDARVLSLFHDTKGFPRIHLLGHTMHFKYSIMEFLGPDLGTLVAKAPNKKFLLQTVLRIAIQTLKLLEEVHHVGFLHRDVKASNFGVGLGDKAHTIYIFDFGLSRRFCRLNGEVHKPRKETALMGTFKYTSVAVHRRQEQCPADDLESWFYMCIEMFTGSLPWSHLKVPDEHEIVRDYKIFCRGPGRSLLLKDSPPEFNSIFTYIDSLTYFEYPNYSSIRLKLEEAAERLGVGLNGPFEWEEPVTAREPEAIVESTYCSFE